MTDNQENIKQEYNNATVGLNMDQTVNQVKKGALTYSLNAVIDHLDSNSINYQNEEGNELCLVFPNEMMLIGKHFISEKNKHIFFLTNPDNGNSEIGYMDNNDCIYHTLVSAPCLNFDINYPIHKVVHKINNCATEIYWTDGINPRRYLNIDDVPNLLKSGSNLCDPSYTNELDCNQLKIQPDFTIPLLKVVDVLSGGNLLAGTYQFAIQYSDALGNPYTSYQSITNPTPIGDVNITTVNFNYPVDKSIILQIDNLDSTGQFQYFNIAVIKTINAISTVELVGTYYIDNTTINITYTGQNVAAIPLAIADIFEKFPYYDIAQDVTATQEILVWSDLSAIDRLNYQSIASQISLQWETWRIPATENYADELNATHLRSQLRDEVYPYEICFLLANGKQTDGFHIPGRARSNAESAPDIPDTNPDFIGNPDYVSGGIGYSAYWRIYNTASVIGYSSGYSLDTSYRGVWQYGEMAYWESTEEYPCNESVWGSLAGQKIRHHKFPDVLVSPIFESRLFTDKDHMVMGNDAVFPIGVRVNTSQILSLITSSNLTHDQKSEIVGYKILRGNRSTNKSIVAKGILRNVGKYTKDNQEYYYPNYPYNDLRVDPFLNSSNNAFDDVCSPFTVDITVLVDGHAEVGYTRCDTGKYATIPYYLLGVQDILCSLTKPTIVIGEGTVSYSNYDIYQIASTGLCGGWKAQWIDPVLGIQTEWLSGYPTNEDRIIHTVPGTKPGCISSCDHCGKEITFMSSVVNDTSCVTEDIDNSLLPDFDNGRLVFNSPETSFGQPFLGNILRLENIIYGKGIAHFEEVKKNAKYKLLTEDAQRQALASSETIADTDAAALIAAYQAYLQIYLNGMTRQNYAYSFNSIADYNYSDNVPNGMGIKQRNLEISRYLLPMVQSVGDNLSINNYQRETSVFLKTEGTNLPFPDDQLSISDKVIDESRFTISGAGICSTPSDIEDIHVISYYASLKNDIVNQWGQIYSYKTIDTGFERIFDVPSTNDTVFGGDTFISRFGFKTKLPFFLDNRVNAPDDSDIFYDQIGNIAYPKYWHSARSVTKDYVSTAAGILPNIISYKAHNFDCPNGTSLLTNTSTSTTSTTAIPGTINNSSSLMFYDGYFYLFAYGVPYFYCESSYNTDLRQAFNVREGDFYPHVTTDIPDDWVQESWVPIAQDNTYYYNTTFSKQNTENTFSHIPVDWDKPCYTYFPFRAIYSDVQTSDAENRVNAWLTYRALSYFDFPQNYGPLTSLDGIQNRAILARFENKSLLYNSLLTIDTSFPQAAYLGNANLFKGAPPIDFAETDLGYVGSQHKMLLKIPEGQVTIDAKRGQVFLISDNQAIDLSGFGSGMTNFFKNHLPFEILRYFPNINVDNNFTGVGLHGVYDDDRVIITKLDYIPLPEYADSIKFESVTLKSGKVVNQFYIEEEVNTDSTTSTTSTSSSTSTSTSTLTSSTTTTTTTIGINYCEEYGALYNWPVTQDARNISSSDDFTVGSKEQWNTLMRYIDPVGTGFDNVAGGELKEVGFTHWDDPNAGATDTYLFNGRGLSRRDNVGIFVILKTESTFWTSDTYNTEDAYITQLSFFYGILYCSYTPIDFYTFKNSGLVLRLVREATIDELLLPDGIVPSVYTGNDGRVYSCTKIGTQIWITENLNETKYRNGEWIHGFDGGVYTPIPNEDWALLTTEAMCYHNDVACPTTTTTTTSSSTTTTTTTDVTTTTTTTSSSTTTTTTTSLQCCYDYFYNGYSLLGTGSTSIANTDWRVATTDDWVQLYQGTPLPFQSMLTIGQYKSVESICLPWTSPNTGALNTYNFNIRPCGFRSSGDGNFYQVGDACGYSRADMPTEEYDFHYDSEDVTSGTNGTYKWGNPVRLVSDAIGISNGTTGTYTGNNGRIYDTVAINDLWWITENLKETLYRDSNPITKIIDNAGWMAATDSAYCIYLDAEEDCYFITTTTTTTTSTSSTTTTTTTIAVPTLVITLSEPNGLLTVEDWNLTLNDSINTTYTNLTIDGSTYTLSGAIGQVINDAYFADNGFLLSFVDTGTLSGLTNLVFTGVDNCTTYSFTSTMLDFGGTIGDDSVFSSISGRTITLTVPTALMTCNSGDPDGDIQYLIANNTVTIITV